MELGYGVESVREQASQVALGKEPCERRRFELWFLPALSVGDLMLASLGR